MIWRVYLLWSFFWSLNCSINLITLYTLISTTMRSPVLFIQVEVHHTIFQLRFISNFYRVAIPWWFFIYHHGASWVFCFWWLINSVFCNLLVFGIWIDLFYLIVQRLWDRLRRLPCRIGEPIWRRPGACRPFRNRGCFWCCFRRRGWWVRSFRVWCWRRLGWRSRWLFCWWALWSPRCWRCRWPWCRSRLLFRTSCPWGRCYLILWIFSWWSVHPPFFISFLEIFDYFVI